MSRLFVYITLSLVLHFLAVLPLLAEQLPSAAKVSEVLIERTSVSVPRLVVKTVSTGLLNQASEQPLAAPVVVQPELKPESEAQKTQGQALAKLKTEIKKIVAQRPYAAVAQPKVLPAKAPESESEKLSNRRHLYSSLMSLLDSQRRCLLMGLNQRMKRWRYSRNSPRIGRIKHQRKKNGLRSSVKNPVLLVRRVRLFIPHTRGVASSKALCGWMCT
jgi:hypothetical protein